MLERLLFFLILALLLLCYPGSLTSMWPVCLHFCSICLQTSWQSSSASPLLFSSFRWLCMCIDNFVLKVSDALLWYLNAILLVCPIKCLSAMLSTINYNLQCRLTGIRRGFSNSYTLTVRLYWMLLFSIFFRQIILNLQLTLPQNSEQLTKPSRNWSELLHRGSALQALGDTSQRWQLAMGELQCLCRNHL